MQKTLMLTQFIHDIMSFLMGFDFLIHKSKSKLKTN